LKNTTVSVRTVFKEESKELDSINPFSVGATRVHRFSLKKSNLPCLAYMLTCCSCLSTLVLSALVLN